MTPATDSGRIADETAKASIAAMKLLSCRAERGWARGYGDAFAVFTGGPIAAANGVWVMNERTPARDVRSAIDAVRGEGGPWCVQARPGCAPAILADPARLGLQAGVELPVMATTELLPRPRPPQLVVRGLRPSEVDLHHRISAEVFGFAAGETVRMITAETMRLPGMKAYVGEVDGLAVTTALSTTVGRSALISNVATLAMHRRCGYGAAITGHVVSEALRGGASWAWLHPTESGRRVYEALGFAVVEKRMLWSTQ